jgi:hypothetical protein
MHGRLPQTYVVPPTILSSRQLIFGPTLTGVEHRLFCSLRTGINIRLVLIEI